MDFYRVCVLDKEGEIESIYYYNGEGDSGSDDLLKLQIHDDDTVNTIKKKILHGLFENGVNISYDEIYLFIKTNVYESPKQLFDSVYKQGDFIDSPIFKQFAKNLGYNILDSDKSKYSYQDILDLTSSSVLVKSVNKSLGINFSKTNDYSFPMNPYSILPDFYYIGNSDNQLLALEKSLLLNDKSIDKSIYVCFAENILEYFERIGGNTMELFPYYFPALSKKGILSIPDLIKEKPALLKETKKIIDQKSLQIYANINLLYDIFRENEQQKYLFTS